MTSIRRLADNDEATILDVVNAAAEAYRGVIPPDRWHEPYMSGDELRRERNAGVQFFGYFQDGNLAGVIGSQPVQDVLLVRHAYVRPEMQRHGIGAKLLEQITTHATTRILIGTWAAARWAIRFYEKNGFYLASPPEARALLQKYWTIPERQIQESVVLSSS